MSPLVLLAAVASALAAGLLVHELIPPPRSLASRLQPYLTPTRSMTRGQGAGGAVTQVFGPIVRQVAEAAGRLLERSGDQVTILKLRQAGWYRQLPEEEMVSAYRVTQLRSMVVATGLGLLAGSVIGASLIQRLVLVGLGLLVGATRQRSRIDKAIETRRELMRIEVYTVNQLLAMRARAGGGVVHAVSSTVARGRGEVINELAEALRLQRAGWRAGDAFRRIAELTPEPFCSRTYRLLASAEERGADLAGALLDLAEDVRETRRELIKRSATKRRAAMLVPTIAILAPVLILFVAAPLPSLITGWR
ncbi:MAG TPA: type II secretion system F family protein [Acidimicrobiia bacterium]|nr:type II secretion system F family protein [Acidimicrobiia bacterium]